MMQIIFKILYFFIRFHNILFLRKFIKHLCKQNPANKTHKWSTEVSGNELLRYNTRTLIDINKQIHCKKCGILLSGIHREQNLPCDEVVKRKAYGPINIGGHDCIDDYARWICKQCDLCFVITNSGYWVAYDEGKILRGIQYARFNEDSIPECSEVVMEKVLR